MTHQEYANYATPLKTLEEMKGLDETWFNQNLLIAGYPYPDDIRNGKYKNADIIINVSTEYYYFIAEWCAKNGKVYAYFPMTELAYDMGVHAIYASMQVLFEAERNNKKVLLHCMAGMNRSPTVKEAYYYMRTGKMLERKMQNGGIIRNKFQDNCLYGFLPSLPKMQAFLTAMHEGLLQGENEMLETLKIKFLA